MPLLRLLVFWKFTIAADNKSWTNPRLHVSLPPMEMECGDHGVFPTWSSPGTSWTEWARRTSTVVLKNTPYLTVREDCTLEFSYCAWMAWTSPSPGWSFRGPATGLYARVCPTPSWSLWSFGTDRAGIVGASLWWLDRWRSVLPCLGLF